jgi:SOS-response transcriptional repressor LexA
MRVCKRLFNSVKRVIVLDDVPPESNAMLQALYSRSPESVVEHLKRVNSVGPEKFMKSYYVGYAIFLIARI